MVFVVFLFVRGAQVTMILRGLLASRYAIRPHRVLADDEVFVWVCMFFDWIDCWCVFGFEYVVWIVEGFVYFGLFYYVLIVCVLCWFGFVIWFYVCVVGVLDLGCECVVMLIIDVIDGWWIDMSDEVGLIVWFVFYVVF